MSAKRKYKVRCKGGPTAGEYTLSFGKSKGKLTAVCTPNGKGKFNLSFDGEHHTDQLKRLKELWGAWAEASYGGGTTSDVILSDEESSTNTADPLDASPAPLSSDDDELTPNERAFLEGLSRKTGPLREFQRAQALVLLRRLLGLKVNPADPTMCLSSKPKGPPAFKAKGPPAFKAKGPPAFKAKGPPQFKRKPDEHDSQPNGTNDTTAQPEDGGAGETVQVSQEPSDSESA